MITDPLTEDDHTAEIIAASIHEDVDTYLLDCVHCQPVLEYILLQIANADDPIPARTLLHTLNSSHRQLAR